MCVGGGGGGQRLFFLQWWMVFFFSLKVAVGRISKRVPTFFGVVKIRNLFLASTLETQIFHSLVKNVRCHSYVGRDGSSGHQASRVLSFPLRLR